MINFVITGDQLRKALADIESAEENGFMYCLAIFELKKAGSYVENCIAEYDDILEKAHPTNKKLDWGRGQEVSKRYTFSNGKLIPVRVVSEKEIEKNAKKFKENNSESI